MKLLKIIFICILLLNSQVAKSYELRFKINPVEKFTYKKFDKKIKKNPKSSGILKNAIIYAEKKQNWGKTVEYQKKLNQIQSPSVKNSLKLANYYSKNQNTNAALKTIENELYNRPRNRILLRKALNYSLEQKDNEKALIYVDSLLSFDETSEEFLMTQGNIYRERKEFDKAIETYEKLVENYPLDEYLVALANLYLTNENFETAEKLIKPIFEQHPEKIEASRCYLRALLAQDKTEEAYEIVKAFKLEETCVGCQILGEKAALDKDYKTGQMYLEKALSLDPGCIAIKRAIARNFRRQKKYMKAENIYWDLLKKDPEDYNTLISLGYIEIDRKNYEKARKYFNNSLKIKPENKRALIAIVNSYIADGEKFKALEELNKIPEDKEILLKKAQLYYNMKLHREALDTLQFDPDVSITHDETEVDLGMYQEAEKILGGLITKDAEALEKRIKKDNAFTFIPSYSFLFQELAETFDLDINKIGLKIQEGFKNDRTAFLEYNFYIYSSGVIEDTRINNFTNEIRIGVQDRVSSKLEYRGDVGVKVFQFGGALLNSNSWVKYFFNDKFNAKIGFKRDNVEQSFLSAVGFPLDGIFTGRAADNKIYIDTHAKLKNGFKLHFLGGYGIIPAQNLMTNQYLEGRIALSKLIYDNPDNKWFQKVDLHLVSYNSSYQFNLLEIPDAEGEIFGGYFSPEFFTANTVKVKVEGKKGKATYGINGFVGAQFSISTNLASPTVGISPYYSYKVNDHVSINLAYRFFNYADIQRDQFVIDAVIKGF